MQYKWFQSTFPCLLSLLVSSIYAVTLVDFPGDLGHYDEDHHFYIVDRLKELIKYKGFQVHLLSTIILR